MTSVKYYDRDSDQMFTVDLPKPGTVWERVPNIKDVLPKGMDMRVSDVPKRVEVQPSTQNPEGLVVFRIPETGKTDAFHPVWFKRYYKETKNV